MTLDSLQFVVHQLLRQNGIHHDKDELSFQIKSHPSYPSLHAVTGVLDHFNIENIAANVPVNEHTLLQLPSVFLAQVGTGESLRFATVLRKEKSYLLHYSSKSKEKLSTDKFLESFTGIVVAVEQESTSKAEISSKQATPLIASLSALLFVAALLITMPTWQTLLYTGLCIVGVMISLAIIKQESGEQTTLGNALCSDASEKKDCDAVLDSDGATLFGRFKFSDLSISYFISMAAISLLWSIDQKPIEIAYYFSFGGIPVIIYSIYYQRLVVKKWCALCLSIVSLLIIQVALSSLSLNSPLRLSTVDLLLSVSLLLITYTGWSSYRGAKDLLRETISDKVSYFRFKRKFEVFSALLSDVPFYQTEVDNQKEIQLGNPEASLRITIVTNPFCIHCKSVHQLVRDILRQYHETVCIAIRFNVNISNAEGQVVKVTTRLLEIFEEYGAETCLLAMDEIYGDSTTSDWLEKWSACKDKERFFRVLKEGKNWCITHQINFTPEILINGRSFPRAYDRPDLIYFIEDLLEHINSHSTDGDQPTAKIGEPSS